MKFNFCFTLAVTSGDFEWVGCVMVWGVASVFISAVSNFRSPDGSPPTSLVCSVGMGGLSR